MIQGRVNDKGLPTIDILIQITTWTAIIDTGFNGELEMPEALSSALPSTYAGSIDVQLGAGQFIEEDTYLIDFPFDGETVVAEATFAATDEILIGTQLLCDYRLEIDFVAKSVLLKKLAP